MSRSFCIDSCVVGVSSAFRPNKRNILGNNELRLLPPSYKRSCDLTGSPYDRGRVKELARGREGERGRITKRGEGEGEQNVRTMMATPPCERYSEIYS